MTPEERAQRFIDDWTRHDSPDALAAHKSWVEMAVAAEIREAVAKEREACIAILEAERVPVGGAYGDEARGINGTIESAQDAIRARK